MDLDIDNTNNVPDTQDNMLYNVFKNVKVSVVGILIIVVIAYIAIFLTLGSGNSNSNNGALGTGRNIVSSILELTLWALLIYIVYISVKGPDDSDISFNTRLRNLWGSDVADLSVDVDLSGSDTEDKKDKDDQSSSSKGSEVFHISGNSYTYEQAKEACDLHGARLATYEEIEKAYDNGANWCSYGWSEDQMAFFPTQLKVYNELKTLKGHENDCGRPGINGGYIKNPNVKFGANCYGKKPTAKSKDLDYMHSINHTPSPYMTEEDVESIKAGEKDKLNQYTISSFNKDKWSRSSK